MIPQAASPRIRILLAAIALALGGCTTYVTPPQHVADPVRVYVVNYGHHSSVILPDDQGKLREFAFGDWGYFAVNHNSIWDAIEALYFSPQSALGRRDVKSTDSLESFTKELDAKRVQAFFAERDKALALRMELDRRWERHADTQVFNEYSLLYMVKDDEHYSIVHNCNHVTARWLQVLGCNLCGLAFWSDFRLTHQEAPAPAKAGG